MNVHSLGFSYDDKYIFKSLWKGLVLNLENLCIWRRFNGEEIK